MIDDALLEVVGVPNADVSAWGIQRFEGGKPVRLSSPNDVGAHVREWPLDELSLDTIRGRWGAGEYRVLWIVRDPTNEDPRKRSRSGGNGKTFALDDVPPVRVAAPAAALPVPSAGILGPDFERALLIMRMGDERAAAQLRSTLEMATALSNRGGGLDAATLSLLLDRQAQTTAQAVAQALAPVTMQLAEIRRELDAEGEDEDDDEPSAGAALAGEVARAAAPALLKKGKIGEALIAYAVENPASVVELVKASPALFEALGKAMSGASAKPAAAPPSVPPTPVHARPRAALRPVPDAPAADGLNGHAPAPTPEAAPVEVSAS
jgi:hypothetical protein